MSCATSLCKIFLKILNGNFEKCQQNDLKRTLFQKEEYASKDDVTEMLGRKIKKKTRLIISDWYISSTELIASFHFTVSPELNVNSYLEGVLGIAEDLVRYATLGVAFGEYDWHLFFSNT